MGLYVPGVSHSLVLGLPEPEDYAGPHPFIGSTVGRYANRIAHGRFSLDGRDYVLPTNNARHHLHGGPEGFHAQIWRTLSQSDHEVVFAHTSPHGHAGYPGRLDARATYRLEEPFRLVIEFEARSDRPTPVSLTHHAYFNLAGAGDVRDHELTLSATHYTPTDEELIPTGERAHVAGTVLDFREPAVIADRVGAEGLDHNLVLPPDACVHARLLHRESGVGLTIRTSEPAMQIYTGQHLDDPAAGAHFPAYAGLCLEPQQYPDAPNQPAFPSPVLRPGDVYRSRTVYEASANAPAN